MHLRGIASDGPRCIAEERDLLRELVELLGAGEQDHTVCDLASKFYSLGSESGQHDRHVARIAQRLDLPAFELRSPPRKQIPECGDFPCHLRERRGFTADRHHRAAAARETQPCTPRTEERRVGTAWVTT